MRVVYSIYENKFQSNQHSFVNLDEDKREIRTIVYFISRSTGAYDDRGALKYASGRAGRKRRSSRSKDFLLRSIARVAGA